MPTITGTILDDAGDPAAGRVVRLYRRDTGALLGNTATSDGLSNGDAQFADVSLLLHGESLLDSSPDVRTLTVIAGTPAADTSQYKFGSASLRFPGGTSRIATASDLPTRLNVGLNEGTIEFFIRFNSFTSPRSYVIGSWLNSSGWTIDVAQTSIFYGSNGAGNNSAGFAALSTNTWYHFAFVFRGANGNTIDLWIDGVFKNTTTRATPSFSTSQQLTIGTRSDGSLPLDAWVDELRITSSARYTAGQDFTPPTAAFADANSMLPAGQYLIVTTYTGEVQRIVLDDDAGTLHNDLIDRVMLS